MLVVYNRIENVRYNVVSIYSISDKEIIILSRKINATAEALSFTKLEILKKMRHQCQLNPPENCPVYLFTYHYVKQQSKVERHIKLGLQIF